MNDKTHSKEHIIDKIWYLRALAERLLIGEQIWGFVRLWLVILVVVLFIQLGRKVYEGSAEGIAPSMFSKEGLRFWIMPVAALIGGLLAAANYIREIYELPKTKLGFQYIIATTFSMMLPKLKIVNGQKDLKPKEVNLIDVIGGPGYLSISEGSVVLLEKASAPSNVFGAGLHYLNRLETVKETAILDDLHGYIENIFATTKDGIRVEVRDIHFRYRLRTGKKYGDYTRRTPESPYPFSVQAMRNMTYHRTVGKNGLTPWTDSIQRMVAGMISNFVNRHQIDDITAPSINKVDPRTELQKEFFLKPARNRFNYLGADLLWIDIGHFGILDEIVTKQRIETWQAKWIGYANVTRAYGKAKHDASSEFGRAEANAELLMSIVNAIDDEEIGKISGEKLRTLFLLRVSKLLESLSQYDRSDQHETCDEIKNEREDNDKNKSNLSRD